MSATRPVSWGVGCWQTPVIDDLYDMIEVAEQHRFDHFWYGNEKLHPDMWVGLSAAALRSRQLRIGTFIADPYSLHPALLASAIATVDHYSGGRAILIFGAGGSGLRELGIARTRPVATVEAAVELVRALLRGEHVQCEGPIFTADARLHFPVRADIPIWVASRAPGMLELAGRMGDGAMIGTIATPENIVHARDHIEAGAASAGRSLRDLTVSVRVDVSVDDDPRIARDGLRAFIAGILSASFPDRKFVETAGVEVPAELEEVCQTKDLSLAWRSGHLVPDELVDAFAWAGTASEVADRVAAAIEVGADDVTLMFHPQAGEPARQLDRFAREVVPRVAALRGLSDLSGRAR